MSTASSEDMTNRQYAETSYFQGLCNNGGITPTKRQASKFRAKRGLAWRNKPAFDAACAEAEKAKADKAQC